MDEPEKVNLTAEFLANARDLAGRASHSPWTSSPQEGGKGHCLQAQVWDENGHALATIEGMFVPAQGTDTAAHIANMHPAVVIAMVDEIGRLRAMPTLDWKYPSDVTNGCWSATTIIGTYSVAFEDGWFACLEGGVKWEWEPEEDPRSYSGPDAAKQACQDHFERTIRSALALSK